MYVKNKVQSVVAILLFQLKKQLFREFKLIK